MRFRLLLLAIAAAPGPALGAQATDQLPGLYFSHADWELACDNTGTCRAAGYQNGQDGPAVSVLLTRKAGPGEPVRARLRIGDADGAALPAPVTLTLRIDGAHAATLKAGGNSVALPPAAVTALLGALPGTAAIIWSSGTHSWQLSSQGATAVLLKMDDFQRRVGTRGALVKPGAGSEKNVLKATPMPRVNAARWASTQQADTRLADDQAAPLRLALRTTLGEQDYCPDIGDGEGSPLTVRRVDGQHLLVSARCWAGAYNVGDGYWLIAPSAPFRPVLVTTSGTEAGDGVITASHKGRGVGDCRTMDAWTWNGTAFVHTSSATTGMCRMVAAGGAWDLPRIVTRVRPAP